MAIGKKLLAPIGWRSISQNDVVYVLGRTDSIVTAAIYLQISGTPRWRIKFLQLNAKDVDYAIKKGQLKLVHDTTSMPPWFRQEHDREWAYRRIESNAKSKAAAGLRLDVVHEVLKEVGGNLLIGDVAKNLNKASKKLNVNPMRTSCMVVTCLVFGDEEWALQPANWTLGSYSRMSDGDARFGRRAKAGRGYAARIGPVDRANILQAYRKYSGKRRTLQFIYRKMLVHHYDVGVRDIVRGENGGKMILKADATSVPSYNQFRYGLGLVIDDNQVYRDRYGSQKERSRVKADKGMYSEGDSNVMAVVERDAYVRSEIVTGFSGQPLGKLYVVHLVDRVSSAIVGIGFSLGSETAEAYRMAEFCSAIDKNKFLELMGMEQIDSEDWPCIGIPAATVTDRGPGSGENVGAVICELTPSYAPQSKPMVENSNPKSDEISGPAQFSRTPLSVVDVMRISTREAIAANCTKDISTRLTNREIAAGTCITPSALWRSLDSRMRNSARQISFEMAVRRYLVPFSVKVTKRGVFKGHQRYRSKALLESGVLDEATKGVFELKAYYLPMNVRQIWIETHVGLLEIEAVSPHAEISKDLYLTAEEQEFLNEELSVSKSAHRYQKHAEHIQQENLAKKDNGKGLDIGTFSAKRANMRTAASKKDMKAIRGVVASK